MTLPRLLAWALTATSVCVLLPLSLWYVRRVLSPKRLYCNVDLTMKDWAALEVAPVPVIGGPIDGDQWSPPICAEDLHELQVQDRDNERVSYVYRYAPDRVGGPAWLHVATKLAAAE